MSDNSRKKLRAARISILTALGLAAGKFVIGFFTGSLAVIASAIDSLLDIVMSGVNFLAIRQAEQPPDAGHPFGHGKFETLATLIQSVVISLSGLWIIVEAVRRLNAPPVLDRLGNGIAVLGISVIVSLWISRFLKKTGVETDSTALEADSLHFAMDVYTNLALMTGLIILKFVQLPWLDPVMSMLVALYILKEALNLARQALRDILDAELPATVRQEVVRLVETHRGELLDMHKLRTRRAGSQKIMDFHLTVCKDLTVKEAHDIADELESAIEQEIRGADVTIHIEPCRRSDCPGTRSCAADKERLNEP